MCGTLQTAITQTWRDLCDKIYEDYQIYYLAGGIEAQTRTEAGAPMSFRSALLVDRLSHHIQGSSSSKKLLEVGCGNGPFLREFARAFPDWMLCGTEFDAKDEASLRRIPGFAELFVGGIEAVRGQFDGFVMVHVLEHLEQPQKALATLRERAASEDAFLLVQVPDCAVNPFALMTIDHATHFTPSSLSRLVKSSGWRLVNDEPSWIPKEISVLAEAGKADGAKTDGASAEEISVAVALLENSLRWLDEVVGMVKKLSGKDEKLGIFGTAIAGTWLAATLLESGVDDFFFVDEQEQRAGRRHLGKPVYMPHEVPADAVVLVAVAPVQSASIATRLQGLAGVRYVSLDAPKLEPVLQQ